MAFNPCLIIPIYNNKHTIREVVESVAYLGIPCLIIDDGSDEDTQRELEKINAEFPWLDVYRQSVNGGKGTAMALGFRQASAQGYSHGVQMDADGQHNALDVPHFLAAARQTPGALILSSPIFDEQVPKSRKYGRLVTSVWVWLETLSFDIGDALCGFRCYPLEPVKHLYEKVDVGHRMDFDPEIAVRLFWQGVPMVNIETKVEYPVGGVSHFNYLRDNLRLVRLHTELVFGMLLRLPLLVCRKFR